MNSKINKGNKIFQISKKQKQYHAIQLEVNMLSYSTSIPLKCTGGVPNQTFGMNDLQ